MLLPKMDQDEIDYFKGLLPSMPAGSKLVEWGSGGSTALFLDLLGDKRLVSIEHNKVWYDKVTNFCKYHPNKEQFTYRFIPPMVDIQFYGYGVAYEETPSFNGDYINPEVTVPIFDADFYLVDGISRGACLATIQAKAKKRDAAVFLHDYKDREPWYQWAVSLFSSSEMVGNTLLRLHI